MLIFQSEYFQLKYTEAVDVYGTDDFVHAIPLMEQALEWYYLAFHKCFVLCEAEYDHGSDLSTLYTAIAGSVVYTRSLLL